MASPNPVPLPGYLYTYAFAMIIGLTMLLSWLIWFR